MKLSTKRLFLRATWLKIHLYTALSVGFLFALLGLTGSLSIYREEIDTFLNPDLQVTQSQGKYQSLDTIITAVRKTQPDRLGEWTIEMPPSEKNMITVWYDKPRETFFERYAPLMISVNPYTAEVVANRFWGQTFTTWILDLHTQLGLDRRGWNVVGVLGLLLMLSVITGLYLWWPGLKALWKTFKLPHHSGIMLLAFDLHRFTGFFSALPLLLLALTGFLLSYPKLPELLLGASGMAHGETGQNLISTAIPNNHPTSLAAAAFVAQGPFPRAELRRVTAPVGNSGIYRINFRQSFEVNQRHPFTTVWVDRWSGQIKEVRNPAKFSPLETLSTWIWPLHTGEALGKTGRFIWFLAGQSVFWLYITGMLRWLYQRGTIKDRNINLEIMKTYSIRLINFALKTSLFLHKAACHAISITKPYAYKLFFWLQLVARSWQNKRLNKK